jgi:hypothetical protein
MVHLGGDAKCASQNGGARTSQEKVTTLVSLGGIKAIARRQCFTADCQLASMPRDRLSAQKLTGWEGLAQPTTWPSSGL